MPSDALLKLGSFRRPAALPDSLAAEIAGWPHIARHPDTGGFYDAPGTPWDAAAEGGRRVLPGPGPSGGVWTLARFTGGEWRDTTTAPASDDAAATALCRAQANRLTAGRRWTRNDLDTLQALTEALESGDDVDAAGFLGGSEGRARSLRSLVTLELAFETGGRIGMDAEARAIAADILAWNAKKQQAASGRQQQGEDLKTAIARAVRTTFPGIPTEVATGAATRLAPAMTKLNRLPSQQAIVDAVAAIRLERWRQAVVSDRDVAEKLQARQARGDTNRAVKRFRDQRAVERVEEELRQWRGDLGPVESRRLG